jgi:ribose transport system permease protein
MATVQSRPDRERPVAEAEKEESMAQTSIGVPRQNDTPLLRRNTAGGAQPGGVDEKRRAPLQFNQEQIVFAIAILLFAIFSVTLHGFLAPDNLLSMLQNVSILGVLGFGMAFAVIGRGIDLAIVTTMVMSVAWMLTLANHGVPMGFAIAAGFGLAALIGLIEGVLIAYVEIPAIFTTLAMSSVIYGFGRIALVHGDIVYLPKGGTPLQFLGSGFLFGVPMPVVHFVLFAALGYFVLQYTKWGRFIRGMGDNPLKARIAGIPTRPMMIVQYVGSSVIGFAAGLIMAMLVANMNTRLVNSTMVYDVILVVVLGGIGLSGGRGGMRNVVVGTVLMGVLLNGMTIMDVPYILQNLVKGLILLAAIIVDTLVNPRDEQTAQQGDI